MYLQEMKNNYLNNVKITLSEGTYKCYSNHLNYIIKYFETKNIYDSSNITLKTLSSFVIDQHNNGVKNSTINKRIKPFKLMFKFNCIENEILTFSKLKEDKNTFTALSKFELNNLINYLNSSTLKLQNKVLIYLLIDTGVRVNELLNIKIKNINFYNNTILLDITKTKTSRIVPFTKATAVLLKELIKNKTDDLLFDLQYSAVRSLFERIKNKLGLSKFHPHMLRHTLASKLHNNGVSIIMIQQIMGHTNVSTTERYIHFDMDDLLSVYNNSM